MESVIQFLLGMLVGGLIVRWIVIHAHRRALMPSRWNRRMIQVREVVAQHLQSRGTLHQRDVESMLGVEPITALRLLDQLETEGIIRGQRHRNADVFYTRR